MKSTTSFTNVASDLEKRRAGLGRAADEHVIHLLYEIEVASHLSVLNDFCAITFFFLVRS